MEEVTRHYLLADARVWLVRWSQGWAYCCTCTRVSTLPAPRPAPPLATVSTPPPPSLSAVSRVSIVPTQRWAAPITATMATSQAMACHESRVTTQAEGAEAGTLDRRQGVLELEQADIYLASCSSQEASSRVQ